MKYTVAELEGPLLDAAVALAEGRLVTCDEPGWGAGEYWGLRKEAGGAHVVRWYADSGEFGGWEPLENQGSPSTDWAVGGPIIERERVILDRAKDPDAPASERTYFWVAAVYSPFWEPARADANGDGPTPLIAAMRAYVTYRLGDEVELPETDE